MDSPALRQTLVALSPQLAAISVGGSIAYPTLLLQQLKNDSSMGLDLATSSWIGSIYGLSGIPVILMPLFMQWKGRKLGYIITCFFVAVGWTLSLTASSIPMILASETCHGFGSNSLLPVSFLSMTEMLSPKYRFIAMQIFGISITLGFAVAGIMGRFLHYKIVSSIMLVPVLIATVIAFFWPESPAWLAHKGKLNRCEKVFTWLRGTDEQSSMELSELIRTQNSHLKQTTKDIMTWRGLWKNVSQRDFYMPALHIFILLDMMYWSGGEVMLIYFIEMVEKSTQHKDASFYASIVMYLIVFLGSLVTNWTVRRFKNKSVLMFSALGVIFNLIGVFIVAFLQSSGTLPKDSLLCIYFLVGYILFYSLGMNSIVFYISAELMPVKHRSLGGALLIIFNCGLYASTLKISPYLLYHVNMAGTFVIYLANAIVCTIYVMKYVPETKDRTLQEIEKFYNTGKYKIKYTPTNVINLS